MAQDSARLLPSLWAAATWPLARACHSCLLRLCPLAGLWPPSSRQRGEGTVVMLKLRPPTTAIDEPETQENHGVYSSPRAGKDAMKCPSSSKGGQVPSSSTICSVQTLSGLDDAHPHLGRQSAEPLSQMLISPGNTLTDTSRNNVFIWVPSDQSN